MRQKTHTYRGYVHPKQKCTMIWHRQLGCWCFDFLTAKGQLSKSKTTKYSYETEKTKAITDVRGQENGVKLPQTGWVKTRVEAKGLTQYKEVVLLMFNSIKS